MMLLGLEWFASLLNLAGGLLVARKQISGFVVTGIADVLLIGYCLLTSQYGLLTLITGYLFINIYGYYYWNNEN